MAYFETSAKDDVKLASDIVDVIGRYVQLKEYGRNHTGLCPFHSEKTPSFVVNRVKQTFHCFGCKKGGDIFTFWMEYHHVTFMEALKDIAELYNIKLPEKDLSHNEKSGVIKRNLFFEINETAARFFRKNLLNKENGNEARIYLKNRGVSLEEAVQLGLGYAPKGWNELCEALKSAKFLLDAADSAGLVVRREKGGFYDRFRNRIIFPLVNMKGQIVGFGGRVFAVGDFEAKYLNTRETEVFHKGKFLYGLNYSADAIRQSKTVFVVEGYMDWLSMYLNGVKETVATLGTALTSWHIRQLKGFASNVVMVFDSDRAGVAAVLKSLPIFLAEGCNANVIMLPEGHDPDSYIRHHGEDGFRSLFERNSQPLIDFFIERKMIDGGSDIEAKAKTVTDIISVINGIDNQIRRRLYIQHIAERLKLSEEDIWSEFGNTTPSKLNNHDNSDKQGLCSVTLDEKYILTIMVNYPSRIKELIACNCHKLISNTSVLEIVDCFNKQLDNSGLCDPEAAFNELKGKNAWLFSEVKTSPPFELNEAGLKLALEQIKMKIDSSAIKETIKGTKSFEELKELLEEKRKINK